MNGAVPFYLGRVAGDAEVPHLFVGDRDALWTEIAVELATNPQSSPRLGGTDQIDDHAIADERLSPQFIEMRDNRRCSMASHLLVPGGR